MSDQQPEDYGPWLQYAREDLNAASSIHQDHHSPRHVCFFAQQAVEKALKAALVASGIEPPRAHNLNELRNMLPA